MIPSHIFSKNTLNYAIKSVNPSYKYEPLDINAEAKEQLLICSLVSKDYSWKLKENQPELNLQVGSL
jgi:hypothetical protein